MKTSLTYSVKAKHCLVANVKIEIEVTKDQNLTFYDVLEDSAWFMMLAVVQVKNKNDWNSGKWHKLVQFVRQLICVYRTLKIQPNK